MEKDILVALMSHIEKQVKELRWVDIEDGQLMTVERPPIALPACLVDMSYVQCVPLEGRRQKVFVELRMTLVFEALGATHTGVPTQVRGEAMRRYDVMNKLHDALQGWTNNKVFFPCTRVRVSPKVRRDRLKVFEAVYSLSYIDMPESQA